MASRKVDSNVLIGLQGCQDLKGKTLKGDVGGKWWEGRRVIVFFFRSQGSRVFLASGMDPPTNYE